MKITITLDFTSSAASDQTSLSPMPFRAEATARSACRAAAAELQPLESARPDSPLPFAAGTPPQTLAASSLEESFRRLIEKANLQCWPDSLLDAPRWSPQEFDRIQRIVLAAMEAGELPAAGGSAPPPPPAPVESSAFPEPIPVDFRFNANLESLFAAIRSL